MNEFVDRSHVLQSITDALIPLQAAVPPWELDGMVCGMTCTAPQHDQQAPDLLGGLLNVGQLPDEVSAMIRQLLGLCRTQLESTDCGFYPSLPEEDEMPSLRAEALGQWCQGFLAGFGAVSGQSGEEHRETLRDLAELAQIDPDVEDSEETAWDLERVTEYLRVAVMDLYLSSRQDAPSTPDGATVH